MNPLFLSLDSDLVMVGVAMPIAVACILSLVALVQARRAANSTNGDAPAFARDPMLTKALLDALQAQAMATVNSAEAMKIFHADVRTIISEGREERQKVMEGLTILLERSRRE